MSAGTGEAGTPAGGIAASAEARRLASAEAAARRTRAARRRTVASVLAALATGLLALVAAILLARDADSRALALRELRVVEQRLERRMRLLGAPGALATLAALEGEGDALRVRLMEALGKARDARPSTRLRHRIERVAGPAPDASALGLRLEGRLDHAAALLDLLVAVEAAARPWPSAMRACRLERLGESVGLSVDCRIEVMHRSLADVPSGD